MFVLLIHPIEEVQFPPCGHRLPPKRGYSTAVVVVMGINNPIIQSATLLLTAAVSLYTFVHTFISKCFFSRGDPWCASALTARIIR